MKKAYSFLRRNWPLVVTAVIVLATFVFLFRPFLEDQYENVAYAIDPSPQRAFEYGELHFNASDPADYDINRAEYFFELAAAKDPTLPYLYHELARISFLKGNFPTALGQIDFQIDMHGASEPNSYYVRGLIEGFMGDYKDSAADYKYFLQFDPTDWAGINDYAWVLLKMGDAQEAATETAYGLKFFPANPWLLNSNAIALYEMGLTGPALDQAKAAVAAGAKMTVQDWLHAYPGNDPKVAEDGIAAFQAAAAQNMHSIQLAEASSTLQLNASHD
jgi:tetratricopeptide (TPR) repeat protein